MFKSHLTDEIMRAKWSRHHAVLYYGFVTRNLRVVGLRNWYKDEIYLRIHPLYCILNRVWLRASSVGMKVEIDIVLFSVLLLRTHKVLCPETSIEFWYFHPRKVKTPGTFLCAGLLHCLPTSLHKCLLKRFKGPYIFPQHFSRERISSAASKICEWQSVLAQGWYGQPFSSHSFTGCGICLKIRNMNMFGLVLRPFRLLLNVFWPVLGPFKASILA